MGASSTVSGDLGPLWPGSPPFGPRPGPPGGATAFMVIDFRPSIADGLAQTAGLSLVLGLAAAGLFAALGLALRRAANNELALLARAERDRQLAAVGEMSAVLAHEIRNPLTSLKGHALLLQEALPDGRRQDKASRVVKEAERLEALTTDLLSFVRSGALDRRGVDPVALLRSAMDAVGAEDVVVDASSAPPQWSLDPGRIRQALENVLKNAVQATAASSSADLAPDVAPATVTVREQKGALVYAVRDHGPGVPAGQQARIFEAFHTTRTRGTGLGLAVAQRVVEQHGGVIEARNHPGGGAEFIIRLPAPKEV